MTTRTARRVHVPRAAEVVAGDLRRRIVTGELAPGTSLPLEAELVAQYGVSRPTLREALRILQSESLISVRQGSRSGALVQPPDIRVAALHAAIRLQLDSTPLSDVFEARVEIGVAAARRLALRSSVDAVAHLDELHAVEVSLDRGSPEHAVAVSGFHAAVVELAGPRSLALVRAILEEIVLAHERATPDVEAGWVHAAEHHDVDDHRRFLGLVSAGDADAAAALWRTHLTESATMVLEHLGADTVVDIVGPHGFGT